MRRPRVALAAAFAAASVSACAPQAPAVDAEKLRRARMMEDLMTGRGAVGGPFTLTDHHGARRSLAEFRGRLVLLYFGYTFCPDVCPTDLVELGALLRRLGRDARRVQVLFVTLDPERDSAKHLEAYLGAFDGRILGLTGEAQEVRAVARRYKAYFAKVPAGSTYLVEHSANFYLIDGQGGFAGSLPPGTKAERLEDIVREHLAAR